MNNFIILVLLLFISAQNINHNLNIKTSIAATRSIGVQCNKYHDYGDMIPKLKTYEETYNVN